MSKRQINVHGLTTEQLAIAEAKIAEKINGEIAVLLNKWRPKFDKYGKAITIEVTINEESEIEISEKKTDDFFDQYLDHPELGVVAKELSQISKEITVDLKNTVTNCNQLLSRYGLACDMAVVEVVKSHSHDTI